VFVCFYNATIHEHFIHNEMRLRGRPHNLKGMLTGVGQR